MGIRDEVLKDIEIRLGGGMVDVELDSAHYELALSAAFRKYRSRSSRGVAEKFLPLQIEVERQDYQLPEKYEALCLCDDIPFLHK